MRGFIVVVVVYWWWKKGRGGLGLSQFRPRPMMGTAAMAGREGLWSSFE